MIHNIRVYTLKELTPDEIDVILDAVDYVVGVIPSEFYDPDQRNMSLSHLNVYQQEETWIYEMRIETMVTDELAQEIIEIIAEDLPVDFDIDASYDETEDDVCVDCEVA